MKRLQIEIPEDLMRELKLTAIKNNTTLTKIVTETLKEMVKK